MSTPADTFDQAFEHHRAGRLTDAARLYQQVVRAAPRHAHAWHQLGCIAYQRGQIEPAIEHFIRAIRLDGAQAVYHNNLGECLRAMNKLAEAKASFEQACRLQTDYVAARVNLSLTLYVQGRVADADRVALDALSLARQTAEEHCVAATLRLLRGELPQAWEEHEWRLQLPGRVPPRVTGVEWVGQPLNGRSILLVAEQGLGDTFQFVRYVPRVRERGGRTVLAAPERLMPLLDEAALGEIVPREAPPPECDFHCALLSLPRVFETGLSTVPAAVPYLHAKPELVAAWRERLAGVGGYRVGINWQGNPAYSFDRARSIPLAEFATLARVPGVSFVSLQKETGVDQVAGLSEPLALHSLGDDFDGAAGAFMDTAAVMRNLDLVITSDTSVAHLAGALGVRVWMALPIVPDWRWLLARDDSPWYPTMRMFRQSSAGNWGEVFARIAAELAGEAAAR